VLDNIYSGPALRISLGTMALLIILIFVNYGAEADLYSVALDNSKTPH